MSKNLNFFDTHKISASSPELRAAAIEKNYFRIMTELCVNRFKWEGLPAGVDSRFMEMALHSQGLAVFFHSSDLPSSELSDKYDRYFCLRGAGAGILNMYDNPVEFWVYGNTMINERIPGDRCVPIWANMLRTPEMETVALYASRLAENDISIDIASMNLRQPTVIVANEETRLSWKNIMQQKWRGAFQIWGAPGLDMSALQKFDVAGDVRTLEHLQLSRSRIWNDGMTMLGIDNSNQEKKERLVAGEVSANNAQVSAYKAVALNSRRYACEQINAMYPELGGKVRVNYNVDIEEMAAAEFTASLTENEGDYSG